jgi:hypothetical protein
MKTYTHIQIPRKPSPQKNFFIIAYLPSRNDWGRELKGSFDATSENGSEGWERGKRIVGRRSSDLLALRVGEGGPLNSGAKKALADLLGSGACPGKPRRPKRDTVVSSVED